MTSTADALFPAVRQRVLAVLFGEIGVRSKFISKLCLYISLLHL